MKVIVALLRGGSLHGESQKILGKLKLVLDVLGHFFVVGDQ
jgi:hypothetical protein